MRSLVKWTLRALLAVASLIVLLLLAVFAVLYAASSVDSVKYRATARALARAFDGSRTSSADPRPQQLSKLAADLERVLAPLSAAGLVSVRRIDLGLEVEISNDLMFDSGRAELETSARAALEALAEHGVRTPIVRLGWPDRFVGHANDVKTLRAANGLSPDQMLASVKAALK